MAYEFFVANLPHAEGELKAIIDSEERQPAARELERNVESTPLMHGECGPFKKPIKLEGVRALCCPYCFLRLKVPSDTKTLGDLRRFFERAGH